MLIFYGLDNFLLNQSVNMYLKVNHLNSKFNQDIHDDESIITYYLEPEYFEVTIGKILNEASTLALFGKRKIIIINDYYLVLNNNRKVLKEFVTKIKQLNNKNIIIVKMLIKKLQPETFDSEIKTIFVDSYNKDQLKKWIIEKNLQYKINFGPGALDAVVTMFPNSLNVIDNELKKMQNLNQIIDIAKIRNFSSNYFSYNPYKLINFWLNKDYVTFWVQYRSYWEKIKYDKVNLFMIATYQLELIRNIKLLLRNGLQEQEIVAKLNISQIQVKSLMKSELEVREINELLVKAHDLDFQVKSGKIAKNLAIDLFFCEI